MDFAEPFQFIWPEPMLCNNNNVGAILSQLVNVRFAFGETTAIPRGEFQLVMTTC